MTVKRCKDCVSEGITTDRVLAYPGPRCATHHRVAVAHRRMRAAENRIQGTYQITAEEYDALLEHQGGRCAICQVANGTSRRLAVDHDHTLCSDHPKDHGCRKCIRGLCCSVCNRIVLGRYPVPALQRAIDYLNNPPAREVLARWAT